MRIAIMGTPDFAVPLLDAAVAAGHDVACVYTQPPRRAGRGKALTPGAVQRRAEALGLPVRHPVSLRGADEQTAFAALDLDAAAVAAYGLLLPPPVLAAPRHGCLNIHGSLLPRWRGAAPVQRAILAGDETTGVAIMQMERGLDTGPVRAHREIRIDGKSAGGLTYELACYGARLMIDVLADLAGHPPVPQPEAGVTYAEKIDKADARIDFAAPATTVERHIRAFNPAPGAWFVHGGERIQVLAASIHRDGGEPGKVIGDDLRIACAEGSIRPLLVRRAGRGTMTAADLLRGFPIPAGTRLPA